MNNSMIKDSILMTLEEALEYKTVISTDSLKSFFCDEEEVKDNE